MDRRGHTCRIIFILVAVCGGQAAVAQTEEDEFAVAAGHYQARRWDLAAETFEAFRQQFPQHDLAADAQFYEAEALAQLGQFAQAVELLDRLIEDSRAGDKLKRAMFRRGEAAYLARDLPDAKAFLNAFWQAYPDDKLLAHLLVYLGDVYAMLEEPAQAEAAYRACSDRFPDGPLATSCTLGLAHVLIVQDELAEAEKLLADLAADDDAQVARRATAELAKLMSSRRDFAAVQRLCEEVAARGLQLDPVVRLLYAEALHEQSDFDKAEAQYRTLADQTTDTKLRRRLLYGRIRLAVSRCDRAAIERLATEFIAAYKDDALLCNVYVAVAEARLSGHSYGEATEAFEAALQSDTQGTVGAQCHAGLAICRAAGGDFLAARDHLRVLREEYQHKWDVASTVYRVAELAYSEGMRKVAAGLFQQAVESTSSPELAAKALSGLAWAQLRQEDLLGSADTFERLLEQYPDDPRAAEVGLLRAQILERRGDFDPALAAYHRVIDEFNNDEVLPKALYFAARLHDRLHQSSEARRFYERLIDEHADSPHAPEARYFLGWLLHEAGDRLAAAEQWQSLHDLGGEAPFWRHATYLLAEDAVKRGDMDRASKLVPLLIDAREVHDASEGGQYAHEGDEAAVPRQDDAVAARSLLLAAQLAIQDDQWQQARNYLARIVVDHPTDPLCVSAEFWVAEADYRLNKFDEAGEAFEQLQPAALGRDDAWVPFVPLRRAQILAHQKQWTEAMAAAQEVIEQHQSFPLTYEAQYVLGRCHAAMGEFDAARRAYLEVIESETGARTETAAMAQWMTGESYMHQRNYDAALRAYLRGEILYPYPQWQARSLAQAGKCYELLEQRDKAEAIYRRLIERFPDADVAEEVRSRLNNLTRQVAVRRE